MSRRSNQKLKLLYLSKIFREQTDEQHGLTLAEISAELEKYGIQCGRKCLYDDIEALRIFGMDIVTRRDRYVRYYAIGGRLEPAELKLLSDFLYDCEVLHSQKKLSLMRRLSELGGTQQNLQYLSIDDRERTRPQAEETYKNINLILKAISQDKKISFKYFEWNSKKQRKLLGGGELFCVSPIKLVKNGFEDKKYLLIAFDDKTQSICEIFTDCMVNLSIAKQKRAEECKQYIDKDFCASLENLRIRCKNTPKLCSDVFDFFGLDITILSDKEDYFEFAVKAPVDQKLFSWLFLQGEKVCLLAPEKIICEYREMLNKAQKNNNEKI